MDIRKIVILHTTGGDKIMMETNLPNPCWPYTGLMSMSFVTAKDTGEDYVSTYFPGVPFEVVNVGLE